MTTELFSTLWTFGVMWKVWTSLTFPLGRGTKFSDGLITIWSHIVAQADLELTMMPKLASNPKPPVSAPQELGYRHELASSVQSVKFLNSLIYKGGITLVSTTF